MQRTSKSNMSQRSMNVGINADLWGNPQQRIMRDILSEAGLEKRVVGPSVLGDVLS